MANETKRDLILSPGTYAYMRDTASGGIKTYSGPMTINPTAQEEPLIYDPRDHSFKTCPLEQAVRKNVIAPEGYYVVLLNPVSAEGNTHPTHGKAQMQPTSESQTGRKIVIQGPVMFPLWPGQEAEVIRGHQLRLNQYLVARVYNEAEAIKNWKSAVVQPANKDGDTKDETPKVADGEIAKPSDLTVGTLLVIRGDQVSFYIPPTGITVQKGPDGEYVREALTLERLEYAVLVGEDGNKRFEKGPQVVFPLPSEKFLEGRADDGPQVKKFRAVEVNNLQGLHIKVIADYTDDKSVKHKAGDEIFITGKDTSIYYPREEHSIIRYDGQSKHFATAVPAGEARYVLDRNSGEIKTVNGPTMLLPDPRTQVIVRRTLTAKQADLWYPGNSEVAEHNAHLRELLKRTPTTRQGAISEGDYERSRGGSPTKTAGGVTRGTVAMAASNSLAMMESSRVGYEQHVAGEEFSRKSTYTQPRTIDLNTKYQGAPKISVHTGYAVQVVSSAGERKVIKGPKSILLDYDQDLEILTLSTGKPKNSDKLLSVVYLRVENNKVSDVIEVETEDHVRIQLSLSYNINFEGDDSKWFSIENYVQYLCHRGRSILQGLILKTSFGAFHSKSRDIIREALLGAKTEGNKRPGMRFSENGMHVFDVDITRVLILDDRIRNQIDSAQFSAVSSSINLTTQRRDLEVMSNLEEIKRKTIEIQAETKKLSDAASIELLTSNLAVQLAEIHNKLERLKGDKEAKEAEEAVNFVAHEASLKREAERAEVQFEIRETEQKLDLATLAAETEATIKAFESAKGGFAEALVALTNKDIMVRVAEAWSIQRAIGGENISEAFMRIFRGTPLEDLTTKIVHMANNGASRVAAVVDTTSAD